MVPWREPYELRGSSTVLREARGEIPRAYSPVAAERTLASIQVWIEKHLRLRVNVAKSGTGKAIQSEGTGDVGRSAEPQQ